MWWSLPGYRHNYSMFYEFPNSNLFTHRRLFSQEKPLVKSMAPGSISPSYTFRSTLLFAFSFICIFYFQIYIIKNPKIPHWILLPIILFASTNLSIYQSFTREGLTTPLTCRVASICSLCADTVYIAWLGPPTGLIPWFHNWGNTYHSCAASSLPLWGNPDAVSCDIITLF